MSSGDYQKPCLSLGFMLAYGLLPAAAAFAQTAPTPATIEACAAVENDADRLACYDTAVGRQATDAADADRQADFASIAKKAQAARLPTGEPARQMPLSDLFATQPGDRASEAIANAGKGSLLDSRWELAKDSKLGTFNVRAYKPIYLLPVFWSSNSNLRPSSPNPDNTVNTALPLDSLEAKFQLSFKAKMLENLLGNNGDVWLGYTQSSRWQIYNGAQSRPFRETDYEPEVLLVFRSHYSLLDWNGRMLALGINHQSNGRADPLSRSWNRLIFNVGLDRDNWALNLRPWVRITDGGGADDNPGIEDYIGRGDIMLVHKRGGHEFSLLARHSLRGGSHSHGALQFDWAFPIHNNLRGYVQVFDGYGESLIDFNHRATYLGLGISLMDWY